MTEVKKKTFMESITFRKIGWKKMWDKALYLHKTIEAKPKSWKLMSVERKI